jgi:hypothetical protein
MDLLMILIAASLFALLAGVVEFTARDLKRRERYFG